MKKNKINLIWILLFTQTSFCTDNSQYHPQSLYDISRGELQRQFIERSSVKRKNLEKNNSESKKQKMALKLDDRLLDKELRSAFEKLETMPCAFAEFDQELNQKNISSFNFNIFITFMKGALSIDLTKPVFNNQTLCVAIIESEYKKLLKNTPTLLNDPQIKSKFTSNFIIEDDWNEKMNLKNTVVWLEKMQEIVNEMNENQSKKSLTENRYARLACKAFSGIFYIIFERFFNEYCQDSTCEKMKALESKEFNAIEIAVAIDPFSLEHRANYEYYERIKRNTQQIFNAIRDEYMADIISAEFITINSSLNFSSDVFINLAKGALLIDLKKKVWSDETFCCGLIESIINLYKLYGSYKEAEKVFLEEVVNMRGRNYPSCKDPLEIMKELISDKDLYSASKKTYARLIFRGVAEIFCIVFERYFKKYPEDPNCNGMKLLCWQERDSSSKDRDAAFDEASIVIIEKSKLNEINCNKALNSKNEWEEFDKWGKKWVQTYDNMKEMEELFDKVRDIIFKKESYHRNECF